MYLYVYDVFLRGRQFERAIAAVENRLTDFGLTGKVARLAALANPRAMVQDEMRFGVKTVVIVGDDDTFTRVVARIADLGVVVGWIPLGNRLRFAEFLGLPYGDAACEALAQRRIVKIDVGVVNGRSFIGAVHIPLAHFSFTLDGRFSVQSTNPKMELFVCNLDREPVADWAPSGACNPTDAQLEVMARPVERRGVFATKFASATYLPFRQLAVEASQPIAADVDGAQIKEKRFLIAIAPKPLKCIVGKGRGF